MGLYDEYVPDPPLACEHCGRTLRAWTGRDGPCRFRTWHQGRARSTPACAELDDGAADAER